MMLGTDLTSVCLAFYNCKNEVFKSSQHGGVVKINKPAGLGAGPECRECHANAR